MSIKLIVGLGNPDKKYQETRHNAGAWLVHALAADEGQTLKLESKFKAQVAKMGSCHLAIPTTYMNESGFPVVALAAFYKIKPEEILIVHDELDLPVGTVRVKRGGGHGGHNGLRHVIAQLGSKEFIRLRIGIDHPNRKSEVSNYVLSRAPRAEQARLDDAVSEAAREIPDLISGDIEAVMRRLHSEE